MHNLLDEKSLEQMLERKDYAVLRGILLYANEVDVAAFLETLPPEHVLPIFRGLGKEKGAEVFSNLSPEAQAMMVNAVTDRELSAIVEELFVDDVVDMLDELPANVVKRVLKTASPDTRQIINQFLHYPDNSVGSIMTAEFLDLKKSMTVQKAIEHIRKTGDDAESIYICYVTDARRHLEGVITLKELLLAKDDQTVEDLMETGIITAQTHQDQEDAVRTMMKYDLLALPVVDSENRLVGLVTVDDGMDVLEEEATEDFEKMAAMAPSEKPYLKTGVFTLARHRIVWLLVLMVSSMVTGGILLHYEKAFAALPLLVSFVPMLTGTGGNAGSQSSTLIIRGMSVNEITPMDVAKVLWKELRVSIIVGFVLSVVNFIRLAITYPGNTAIALTVAIAMFATIIMAKIVGSLLPMAAKALKLDPAIMAAPLISTIVDAASLVLYFTIAESLLPIP